MTGNPWSARGPILAGVLMLAVLLGGFGLWSVATTIQGAVIAQGQLEVEQNRQVVQHPDGGVVAEIRVTEGARVAAGDVLLRLDGAMLTSELTIVEGQLYEILARKARLEAERDDATQMAFPDELTAAATANAEVADLVDGQARLFSARRETAATEVDQLRRRAAQTQSQIEGIVAQSAALGRQLELIRAELAQVQTLREKGLAEEARVLALQREEARLQGQVGELAATKAASEGRITEIEIEILRLAAARREDANAQLRDLGFRELELAERRRALVERIARLDIVAPVSGIVLGLQVTTPRAVLRAADPVLFLVPQDRPLVIAAQVQPTDVDALRAGQPVVLTFPAFNTRTTPELKGHVTVVSADALTDARTQAPYFRAEIEPDAGELARLGDLALVPGMPVTAFIQTDARTPLAYLIKPFTDYFARAFRES